MPPTIHAYVFDLDGTLIDSEVIWVEAIRAYLVERTGGYALERAKALVYGRSWRDIHQDIIRDAPALTMPIGAMEAEIKPYYQRIAAARDIRIPSSIALLQRLAETHPVCIVSGSSTRVVQEAVAMMEIGHHLQFLLGADDYAPGKPDPTCFRLAATRLGVPPEACLVFEDSRAGVTAAKAAGMWCVALVRPGYPSLEGAPADLIMSDLSTFDTGLLGK